MKRMNKKVTVRAFGKLNLFLDITGRRADGYHLLQTVMQSVSVFDVLTFELSEGIGTELVCSEPSFPCDSRNLIWKAIDAFYAYTGTERRGKVTVTVEKNIPSMAGMAGGSADCAAALAAMDILCGTGLDITQLCEIGIKLGADVPFTLTGGTVLCEGIGERLTVLPKLPELYFAVVKPDVGISTPEAYRLFDSCGKSGAKSYESFEKALRSGSAREIADGIYNALEVAADIDEINTAKKQMLENGAHSSMMTGSGSAVFGIFESEEQAQMCVDSMSGYSFAKVLTPVGKGWEIAAIND